MSNQPSASEIIAKLLVAPRPHELVPFPRKGPDGKPLFEIAMVLLSQIDQFSVSSEAEKTAHALLKGAYNQDSQGYRDIFNTACVIETLWRACKDPNDPKMQTPFFINKASISQICSNDELTVLYNHYLTVMVSHGPVVGAMSEVECELFIDDLMAAGNSQSFFLNGLSLEAFKTLVIFSCDRWHKLAKEKNSSGSSPDMTMNLSLKSEEQESQEPANEAL
jgi:hypothetical protein